MRYLLFFASLFAVTSAQAQSVTWADLDEMPASYQIDGSFTVNEVSDTIQMNWQTKASRYVVKKSDEFTYVAVRTNSSTILNVYLIDEEVIKVLHASAALGQVNFNLDNGAYQAEQKNFDWIYRDPQTWDEMHPDGVTTIEEFYERFGWMANTWHMGSYREFEMLIDNQHFTEDTRLVVSYTSKEGEESAIRFMENGQTTTVTGDSKTDEQLHNGYLPATIAN